MNKIEPVLVYPWGIGSIKTKHPHTEPIGIARVDKEKYHVVKVNWRTNLDVQHSECKYQFLTKAEYDMHSEFGTFPVLKAKYCWLTRDLKDNIIDFCLMVSYIYGLIYVIFIA